VLRPIFMAKDKLHSSDKFKYSGMFDFIYKTYKKEGGIWNAFYKHMNIKDLYMSHFLPISITLFLYYYISNGLAKSTSQPTVREKYQISF